ncbi:fructosamine kinase family protein [Kangiella sp. TOML190]|uniref:fructosamine kinase family protein n=1 Tax=Kangiella sp. TOML190 TaxID=2931351 RepID=UPI00203A5349|nr:fructosamine kinase family protein [Kangiella sp. TOML190]
MQVFIKENTGAFSDALLKEAEALAVLDSAVKDLDACQIKIPRVLEVSEQQLVLQKIESRAASSEQMRLLGQSLARLHQVSYQDYGLDTDNYIGLNPQRNIMTNNWGEFFFEQRLIVQVSFIKDLNVRDEFSKILLKQKLSLINFLNQHCAHPGVVHGDLWSGNVLFDKENVWLIDPALYYGDREVDLAMTEMFGVFSTEFYHGYDSVYPRTKAYSQKKQIYNLYHYLNHYNLFGDGYFKACLDGLKSTDFLA